MREVLLPLDHRWERLKQRHPRRAFRSNEPKVDEWLHVGALQSQAKHLSSTKVLLDIAGVIIGYYTLATGQVDFSDLPNDVSKHLPRRILPVGVIAWLGVDANHHGHGFGTILLSQALRDCWEAAQTFPFIAVVLDSVNDRAKEFYRHWGFSEMPGPSFRIYVSVSTLEAMMETE